MHYNGVHPRILAQPVLPLFLLLPWRSHEDINGAPINTEVLTTFTGTSTSTSTLTSTTSTGRSTSTTTSNGAGGPIGYTTSTNGQVGPTTFVYTTTDMNGDKTVLTSVFTPTYEPTSPWPSVPSGTMIPYSEYTSANPQTSGGASRKITSLFDGSRIYGSMIGITIVGVLVGGFHVIG